MQITADEYHLLKEKILPKNVIIGVDSLYRIYFLTTDNKTETLDKLKVRQVIKEYVYKLDIETLKQEEIVTLIGLLLKCIKI